MRTERIAFAGSPGAFAEEAARQHAADCVTVPVHDFRAVIRAVSAGTAEFGVIPVRNTIIGPVPGAADAIQTGSAIAIAETVRLRVRHCLVALPGSSVGRLRTAESHPAALAQCSHYLAFRRIQPVAARDTASAAHAVSLDRNFARAAIASRHAAERYGLGVLADDIANASDNHTDFAIVVRTTRDGMP